MERIFTRTYPLTCNCVTVYPHHIAKSIILFICLLMAATVGRSQQVIGSFPDMEGNFENVATDSSTVGTVAAGTQLTKWTGTHSGSTSKARINTSIVRTGSKSLEWVCGSTSSSLLSKSAANLAIANATSYVIQFYWWKGYSGSARNFGSFLGPAGTNNMGNATSSTLGVSATSFEWTKETIVITTGTNNSNPRYGMFRLVPNGGSFATSPGYLFDDFCVYAGTAPDVTAPDDVTSPAVTGFSASTLDISWTAPASGVDGGGYVVVRYTSNPTSEPAPNVNGIYAAGNTLGTGTIAYIGTNTSFTDVGLTPNSAYYYKVYVADKAFNYSPSPSVIAGYTGIASPSAISFTTPSTCNTGQLTLSWTGPLNYVPGSNTILAFLKQGSAVTVGTPTSLPTTYTANTTFGSGTAYQNDAAAYCIYNGDGTDASGNHSGLTITGLNPGTTYHVVLFNIINSGNTYSPGGAANGTTLSNLAEPANHPGAFGAGAVTTSNIPLTWTAAGGSPAPTGYLIQASNTANPADPTDFIDPANQTDISAGSALVKTTGTSYSSFTGFAAGTMYYFSINSYTNSATCIDYKTPAPAFYTATLPNPVTGQVMSIAGGTGVINWAAATGYNAANHTTLVFVSGSPITTGTPTASPGTYTANTAFGAGTAYQLDANARCVYTGDGTSVSVTGFTASNTYYVLILTVVDAANSNGTHAYSAYATTSATYNAATEYTWIGGSAGSWATSSNWSPTRMSITAADVMIFNTPGGVVVSNVPTQTIAKLVINNGDVTLQAGSGVTLTIQDNDGASFTDLSIAGGASLTMGTNVNITLAANTASFIVGTLNINASRTYNTNNTGAVTTISGMVNNQGTYTSTNAARTIVTAGGTYNHNVNNGTLPLATWNFNSACLISGVTTLANFSSATHGQVFSKFIWDCPNQNSPTDAGEKRFVLGAGGINTTTGPFLIVTDSFIVKRTNGSLLQLSSSGGQRDFTCGNYFQYGGKVAITFNTDATGEQRSLTVNNTFYLTDSLEADTKFQIINNPGGQNIVGRLFVGGHVEMHPTISAAIIERVVGGAAALAEIWFTGSATQNVRFDVISGSLDFVTNHTGPGVMLQSNATANLFRLTRGTFFINGNTLTINNAVSYPAPGTGSIGGSATSNLTIGGTAGPLNFFNGYRLLKDFTLNTNASCALGTELAIVAGAAPGRVSLASGAALSTSDNLVLRSDNQSTARVAPVPVDGGGVALAAVNGKVQVERYLPMDLTYDSRRWRLLTAPFKNNANAPTINEGWQEGAVCPDRFDPNPYNPRPGYGTHITVSTVAANGFDQGVRNNPSIYYYTTGGWGAPGNTNSTKLTDHNGVYMLFARGDRSIVIVDQFVDARPTTLAPRGELNLGTVSIPMVSSGMQAVGNPYASQVKLDNIDFNGVLGKSKTIYLWDPKCIGSSGVGAFITCSGDGAPTPSYTYTGNNSNYGAMPGVLESSGAFMVEGTGGNIIFRETDKTTASSTIGMASRPMLSTKDKDFGPIMKFYTDLYLVKNKENILADGVANTYNPNYKNAVDEMDATKLLSFNTREKLMIEREGVMLSVERRRSPGIEDTIFLVQHRLNISAYKLAFRSENFDDSYTAYLKDNFAGTLTPIDITNGGEYSFNITADAASAAANRFYITFRKKEQAEVPAVKAWVQDANVDVEWEIPAEAEGSFVIEKSKDGGTFVQTGRYFTSTSQLKWIDENPGPGSYRYRLRYTNAAGEVSYSNIAAVVLGAAKPFVYPNPVQNGQIGLQMGKLPAGRYTATLLDSRGTILQRKVVNHQNNGTTQWIPVQQAVAKGMYKLELSGSGKTVAVLSILLQ
ncbi:MAG TPA: hypothetical protein PKC39_14280 [Ferruginibacter sp.]|nr:hypothetical protein [Ferruginibacter sp.]